MKISSKSILSPCRGRNTPICLSTSLSRRLRTNTSLKGGQSPMFPTSGKKRGCALENPGEPSSPKVTCIGQVRVKTKKKQGKRMRGGEVGVGFGRVEQSREGFNNNNHPNQIQNQECLKHRNQRWVHLPLSICEALRGFGSEFSCLFQCGREKEEKTEAGERSLRRRVDLGEKIGIEEEKWEVNDCIVEEEEEESRVSICIPPKNALLLMRCRSDPMRVSALTNRLWELQSAPEGEEEDNDDHEEIEMSENLTSIKANEEEEEEEEEDEDEDEDLVMEVQEDEEKENPEDKLEIIQEEDDNEEEEKQQMSSLSEAFADPEKLENEEEKEDASNLIQERESHHSSSTEDETEEKETQERLESEERERESHENLESENKEAERERRSVLPDCLLLMMREPKLSMEVSKETWVCSTDFIRWLPERPVNTKDGSDDPKKRISIDSNNPAPPRSSCSFPAPASMSMAAMIEHKLACEPLVLKRCKSEPRRSAAAKLAPETCFWKNRNLEPHRRATFGVGAAGVGF